MVRTSLEVNSVILPKLICSANRCLTCISQTLSKENEALKIISPINKIAQIPLSSCLADGAACSIALSFLSNGSLAINLRAIACCYTVQCQCLKLFSFRWLED